MRADEVHEEGVEGPDFEPIAESAQGRCSPTRSEICRTAAREKDRNTTRCSASRFSRVRAALSSAIVVLPLPGPPSISR